ncbi:hypothetical protein AVEN_266371-1 [Araneus ventricosus]|uniref:Uncharacterized protein n=1 Tax=Araneus ventricosus TaxID=182803 RepID=A0A4Y2CT19_ARAVE|nr:hypothetical protein AVEN_266371-1 [Araneus ventricosus]
MGPVARYIIRSGQTSSGGVAWKFGKGVTAQVSSSSSDRDSKLRGPSQNSPRVASKRDVNIIQSTKEKIENDVVLKFGTVVVGSVLNDKLKVPAGGGCAGVQGDLKGGSFQFFLNISKTMGFIKNHSITKLNYI